jgi:apolipoprotein N-acyltransferase
VLAAFVALAGFLAARCFRTRGAVAALVTLPALFVLCEWLRGWAFTGFGWLSAGYSQTNSWLMGYAAVLGVHGISWAVLVTAGALATLATHVVRLVRSRRGGPEGGTATGARALASRGPLGALVTFAVVWGLGLGFGARAWTAPQSAALDVALVQGDIAQDTKWKPEQLVDTLELYARLTRENVGADLIVWPEAAVPTLYDYPSVKSYLDGVRRSAAGSTVLLGILRDNPGTSDDSFQNALLALTEPPQLYLKRHLVPFGEYFPVPDFIRTWMRMMNLPSSDAVAGSAVQPSILVGDERIAVTICYEDVFGAEQLRYLPAATLLVNVSNDAWFGDSIAPHQHRQIAQVRAAEAGRYLLRATNTGITAVIDPRGRVVATLPQFAVGVLKQTVRGYTGATPYARWGNWLVVLAALAAALATLLRPVRPRD